MHRQPGDRAHAGDRGVPPRTCRCSNLGHCERDSVGIIKPGDPPTEIDVTFCNDSPVDYPAVGITTVLTKCSCATNSMGLPDGRIQRFDTATNAWVGLAEGDPDAVEANGKVYVSE